MTKPAHVYQAFIRKSPKEVWEALTNGDITVQYFYGTRVVSDWEPGSRVQYLYPDGTMASDGEVIAIDPPHRLEMTFHALWDPELEAEGPAREVWLVEDANGLTKLTVELYDVADDSKTLHEFVNGFPYIFSGLKTYLETGEPLAG